MTPEELLFFDAMPASLPLYGALRTHLLAACPGTTIKVSKTQISLSESHLYACISLPRRKKDAGSLVLTLGLPGEVQHPLLMAVSQPYPGRYTHHFLLRSKNDFTPELLQFISLAHAFALRK